MQFPMIENQVFFLFSFYCFENKNSKNKIVKIFEKKKKIVWTTDNAGETFNWKGGIHTAIDAEVSYLTAHPTHTHVAAVVATTKYCFLNLFFLPFCFVVKSKINNISLIECV